MIDVSKGVRDLLDLVTVLRNDVTAKDAEITRLRAERDALQARCNDMGDAWIAQKHAWQEAVEDALLQWCDAPSEGEAPKDALRRLIQHEITAALDPAVSQSAADLVATARREGMEDAAKIAESEPELPGPMPAEFEKHSRETLARAACIATKRGIVAAIRAAAEGKKND